MGNRDSFWSEEDLEALHRDFGQLAGRTALVTGADGFMGSHVTDALVELGADVHAFVRATSSGSLNNIAHLKDRLTERCGLCTPRRTGLTCSTSQPRRTLGNPGTGPTRP